MTREILFRGKKHGNGGWAYGSLIVADDFCCILEDESNVHPMDYPYLDGDIGIIDGKATPIIPETVGQWTGLADKNGVKIFEGDVLDSGVKRVGDKHGNLIVITDIRECKFAALYVNSYEVIGNIYDNPELVN